MCFRSKSANIAHVSFLHEPKNHHLSSVFAVCVPKGNPMARRTLTANHIGADRKPASENADGCHLKQILPYEPS
jgi:hypothetical protein